MMRARRIAARLVLLGFTLVCAPFAMAQSDGFLALQSFKVVGPVNEIVFEPGSQNWSSASDYDDYVIRFGGVQMAANLKRPLFHVKAGGAWLTSNGSYWHLAINFDHGYYPGGNMDIYDRSALGDIGANITPINQTRNSVNDPIAGHIEFFDTQGSIHKGMLAQTMHINPGGEHPGYPRGEWWHGEVNTTLPLQGFRVVGVDGSLIKAGTFTLYGYKRLTPVVLGEPTPPNPTVLLLHFDGADGAQSFPDSSDSAHSVTRTGAIEIDDAWGVFGQSALFAGGYLTIPEHEDWNLANGDFAFDLRVRSSTISGSAGLFKIGPPDGVGSLMIYRSGADVVLYASSNGTSWDIASGVVIGSIAADTPAHIEIDREGDNWYLFKDGVLSGNEFTNSAAIFDDSNGVVIGRHVANYHLGAVDELHLRKGEAAHTSNFTPPAAPYGE